MPQVDKKYLDLTGLGQLITKLRAAVASGGTHELVAHPVVTAVQTAGAYKVSVDANGHVTLGTTIAASDVGAVPTSRKVNNKALSADITLTASDVGAVPTSRTIAGLALSDNIATDALIAALGLTQALVYIGTATTTKPSAGNYVQTVIGSTTYYVSLTSSGTATQVNAQKGQILTVGYKEYICTTAGASGTNVFTEMGDESSYALKTISISGGNGLTGGGTLASNRTISHASGQQAAISTPGLYKIGCDTYGHVIIGTAVTSTKSDGAHTHSVSGTATVPANTYVTAVNTKGYSWSINKGTSNANVASVAKKATSATTVGNANVGLSYTHIKGFHVNDVAKDAYTASYDSTNGRLTLTPLSLSTDTFYGATSSSTQIYGCADEVSVLKDTTTISVSNPSSGAQATLAYEGTKNSAASLNVSGTAASDGAHTHDI